jgi:type II secretory pathway component PulF
MKTSNNQNVQNITLSYKDKIALLGNFSTMLAAGISILESVDSLLEDAKGNQQKVLQALRDDLTQGKHVYVCFARFPQIFDQVTINIIKASEEAGTLDVTLVQIKEHIQKEMEFLDKIRGAMVYPVMIFFVFILVMVIILVFVMPRMAGVFIRMKVELPLPTKVLIFLSDLLTKQTIPVVLTLVSILGIIFFLYKKKRSFVLRILYSFPIVSDLIRQIDITRFSSSMSLLLASGLTITQALELCENIVSRHDMQQLVKHTHTMVLSGKRMSEGLRAGRGLVPMIVIKIIEAGEKTGSLDKSLKDISEYMDYQVSKSLSTLTTLMEPIMLIFIGIVVGGMMISIIAPIYGLIGQIGGR